MKNKIKKALALLLTVIMLVGVASISALATQAEYKVGDIITFGSYPQSKVTDSATISALNSKAGSYSTWTSYGYYSGTGDWDDGNMAPSDYMKYKDVTYNGVKYRGVYFTAYRPIVTGITSSSLNSEQDDNGYYTNTAYWFKYEPLTWRVLDPSEGFVMCNKAIDSQAYQNIVYYNSSKGYYYNGKDSNTYASDWKTSSIKEWLNNDFYNTAFTASEKSKIGTSHLENKSTDDSTYDSSDTYDKIFLLSYWDVINSSYGFNSSSSAYDPARQIKSTDYAQAQGCYTSTFTSYYGNSWWRLRSPGSSYYTAFVGSDGYAYGYYRVFYTYIGVVPAFKFNPKSTICDNHNYISAVTPPTCTDKGYTTHTCTCGDSYVDTYVDATGHTYGEWGVTSAPTTLLNGVETRYCQNCDFYQTRPVDKLTPISAKLDDISTNYKKVGHLDPQITNPDNVSYTVDYKSSNPNSVIVDSDGNYFAVKTGSAKITCTLTDEYGNITTAECNINVKYNAVQWIIMILLFGWLWY